MSNPQPKSQFPDVYVAALELADKRQIDGERWTVAANRTYIGVVPSVSTTLATSSLCVILKKQLFWNWLRTDLKTKECRHIVLHRAVDFCTITGFWDELEKGEWFIREDISPIIKKKGRKQSRPWRGLAVCEDPPTIIVARPRRGKGSVKIFDIRNWGIDFSVNECSTSEQIDKLMCSVHSVKIGMTAAGMTGFHPTAASAGIHFWKSTTPEFELDKSRPPEVRQLEREAYYGGRCEVRQMGVVKGPVYHFDFNWLYAAAVNAASVPIKWEQYSEHAGQRKLAKPSDTWVTIAEVDVDVNTPCVPYRRGDITLWPTGRFRTVLCEPELWLAYDHGRIRKIHRVARYKTLPVFAGFVSRLWNAYRQERDNGNFGASKFLKRATVGTFGKFASHQRKWIDDHTRYATKPFSVWEEVDARTKQTTSYRSIAWLVQRQEDGGELPWTDYAIAAWVTSLARVRLFNAILIAGPLSVYYYDTDSLFVSERGADRLERFGLCGERDLGKLKLVDEYRECEFRGIRHYVADGRVVCAGLPEGFKWVEPAKRFLDTRLQSFKESLRLSRSPQPIVETHFAQMPNGYRHGLVGPYGHVSPIHITKGGTRGRTTNRR